MARKLLRANGRAFRTVRWYRWVLRSASEKPEKRRAFFDYKIERRQKLFAASRVRGRDYRFWPSGLIWPTQETPSWKTLNAGKSFAL